MTLADDRAELARAIESYRMMFPEPLPLSPNLALAQRLLNEIDKLDVGTVWEYGIFREDEPSMDGPHYRRVVSTAFTSARAAFDAIDRVPALSRKSGPFVRRRISGEWETVNRGDF